MGFRVLPLSPSQSGFICKTRIAPSLPKYHGRRNNSFVVLSARKDDNTSEPKKEKQQQQSLFSSVTEALDFSQVRSEKDAELLEDAREATKSGGRMSKEQVINLILLNSGLNL